MSTDIEKQIYNAMLSRETKLEIDGIEVNWDLITGTTKNRERKAKKQATLLVKLLIND